MVTKKVTYSPEYRQKLVDDANAADDYREIYSILRNLVIYDTMMLEEGQDVD